MSFGRFSFGQEAAYRFKAGDGMQLEPFVAIQGIWAFDKDDAAPALSGLDAGRSAARAKIQPGLTISKDESFALRASGHYDGIGDDKFEACGGQLWLNVPLN